MTMDPPEPAACAVVELRRYTLRPGARDTLIELFDRELVETQEDTGMAVLAQFRDLDDPDAFVWLRGFRGMEERARGLQAFYGGPVWAEHGPAANATMLDSDDVLLLRPVAEMRLDGAGRPAPGGVSPPGRRFGLTTCALAPAAAATFPDHFAQAIAPALRAAGAELLAAWQSEHSPNTFPRLPVREGEEVFVWLSRFADGAAQEAHAARVDLGALVGDRVTAPPAVVRLEPTARSRLR